MERVFASNFKHHIEGLIEHKHALGYPYLTSERVLFNFDRFCCNNFQKETNLSQEIVFKWTELRDNEQQNGRRRRVSLIRELAKYISLLGEQAYIMPADFIGKEKRYTPHIFSEQELAIFFTATDCFEYDYRCPARHFVIPVIFRVIYCCGLRPGEALRLKTKDVNLDNGKLQIVESKGHKDRYVLLSDDVLNLCRKYHKKTQYIYPDSEYFFPNNKGKPYSTSYLDELFWRCWNIAGISSFNGSSPRPYNFRHTFTTNCMNKWIKEGKDLNAWLPYLSAYLGHEHYDDTLYYYHLVPEFFPQMAQMNIEIPTGLVPEVRL